MKIQWQVSLPGPGRRHAGARYFDDPKRCAVRGRGESTDLFVTDLVLQKQGAKSAYWKTDIKRRTNEIGACRDMRNSGQFNKPFFRGYDDGLVSAMAACSTARRTCGHVDGRSEERDLEDLVVLTISSHCADEVKYAVVDAVVKHFETLQKNGDKVGARKSAISLPSTVCVSPSRTGAGAHKQAEARGSGGCFRTAHA